MRVLFAHGLWSAPGGSKPAYMKEVLGWDVFCPDMRRNGWSISAQTLTIRQELESSDAFDVLIGSSFGALAIANAVEEYEGDFRLILLAPAFGVYDTLASQIGDSSMEIWREDGIRSFAPPDWEEEVLLPWSFMEDALSCGWPVLQHRTAILHGRGDEVVPVENSYRASRISETTDLMEVDDGHRLAESLDMLQGLVSMVLA
jgi:pimeloyl-ACP methyl ester carboxylesterase